MVVAAAAIVCAPVLGGAGQAAAAARRPAAEASTAPGTGWGQAQEVPGIAALNAGGLAMAGSVSCRSAGDCSAGGSYEDGSGHSQAFVVTQTRGRWGSAIEVPGLGALNTGGTAELVSVSCGSAGNCSAGGSYTDSAGSRQAFVVTQARGRWGSAMEVPGLGALNTGGFARVESLSCGSAGNCSVGGFFTEKSGAQQAFVVTQVRGRWGKAIEVPGLGALNRGENAQVASVSCASAGNCSAGGTYEDSSHHFQAFVVTQVRGRWGRAIEVPGLGALNRHGDAQVASVSCPSAGNCSAGGFYASDHRPSLRAFVVTQTHGRWGKASEVEGGATYLTSVSCASAGNCSAGGFYQESSGHSQAFVVTQVRGRWGRAIEVPGTGTLNLGGNAQVASVSCASAGNCSAGGSYQDGSFQLQVFVVSEVHGRWGKAEQAPGLAAVNEDSAQMYSLSCAPAGTCSAGGYYDDGSGRQQAFVVSKA